MRFSILHRYSEGFVRSLCTIDGAATVSTPADGGAGGGSSGGGGAAPSGGGDGGSPGAPAPSPSPTPVQPSEIVSGAGADQDAFHDFTTFPDGFEGADLDDVEVIAEPPAAPQQPAATKPAAPAPAPAPAAPAAPQAAPAAQPAAEAAPAPSPQGALDPTNLDQWLQGMNTHKAALMDHLAAQVFTLSDQEKAALDTDAVGAIPKIMARVHLEAVQAAMQNIHQIVPALVNKMLATRARSEEADNEFYGAWKQLNRAEHGAKVRAYAGLFRNANPQATRAQAIQAVGRMVCAELGIPFAGTPQPAPAAPGNGAAAPAPRPVPFAPARPGTSAPTLTPIEESPFAGMGRDYDEE